MRGWHYDGRTKSYERDPALWPWLTLLVLALILFVIVRVA
jgi:hypothetical protein